MRTILVTGGAGFIGSHTVVELAAAGYKPVIVDDFSNSDPSVIDRQAEIIGQPVKNYDCDYRDTAKLKEIIASESADGVIHFAAYKSVSESVKNPLKYYENNVSGLIELLKLCETSNIKNFVFSSSCTVYGEPDKLPVTENSPFKVASSPYGATKQMGETILRDATLKSSVFNSVSLRYFNPIGAHSSALIGELPKGEPANLVPYITQTAAGLRDKLKVFGDDYPTDDGTCIRDYIHVVDLAKAHVKALSYLENKPVAFQDAINVGTGKGSSVLEVINLFIKETGQDLPYEIAPRRTGDLVSTYAAVDKASQVLGWKAEKTLAQGLVDAWRWQESLKDLS